MQSLGEETFHKAYEYLKKQRLAQRTDPTLDDAKINQGLAGIVKTPSDCSSVQQLVYLEILWIEKTPSIDSRKKKESSSARIM